MVPEIGKSVGGTAVGLGVVGRVGTSILDIPRLRHLLNIQVEILSEPLDTTV